MKVFGCIHWKNLKIVSSLYGEMFHKQAWSDICPNNCIKLLLLIEQTVSRRAFNSVPDKKLQTSWSTFYLELKWIQICESSILIVFHCGRTNNWVLNVTQLQKLSNHKKAPDKKPCNDKLVTLDGYLSHLQSERKEGFIYIKN